MKEYGNIIEILGVTSDTDSNIKDFITENNINTFSVKINKGKLTYLNKSNLKEFSLTAENFLLTVQKTKE